MIDMEKYVLYFFSLLRPAHQPHLPTLQEGLKAHEGGHNTGNPFDIFQSFFGGRALFVQSGLPFSDIVFIVRSSRATS